MSKVEFGLSHLHYAPITEGDDGPEFGTPVAIPGAVSLTLEDAGDTSTFYADNISYYVSSTSSSKTGTMTIARAQVKFLEDLLGYETDDNGVVVQFADAVPKPFALLYEVATDTDPVKFVLYNVTLSSPSSEHNTTTDTTEPDTQEYSFTAAATNFDFGGTDRAVLGAFVEKSETSTAAYNAWYTAVKTPSKASA